MTVVGLAPAAVLLWAEAHAWPGVVLRQSPLAWPEAPVVLVVVLLLPALAAVLSPTPPRLDAVRRSRPRTRPSSPATPTQPTQPTHPAVAP